MKKDYSLLVHAIHSRLQLIRHLVDFHLEMKPEELIEMNRRFFIQIAKSVEEYHGLHAVQQDFQHAAFLFLYTITADRRIREEARAKTPKPKCYKVQKFDYAKAEWNTVRLGEGRKIELDDRGLWISDLGAKEIMDQVRRNGEDLTQYRTVEQPDQFVSIYKRV